MYTMPPRLMLAAGPAVSRLVAVSAATRLSATAASAVLAWRSHYTRALPSLTVEHLEKMRAGKHVAPGHPLNEHERLAVNAAVREGFLQLRPHCGLSAANAYYKYCWNVRRPYVGVNRDGYELFVDVGPVAGMAKAKRDADVDKALDAYRGLLAARKGVQVVNDRTMKAHAQKLVMGAEEGTNASKEADRDVDDVFTVYVGNKAEALALATEMHTSFTAAFGLPTRAQIHAAKDARVAAQKAADKRTLLRKLRRLVADPLAVKNLRVPMGAIDGFVAHEKAGTTEAVFKTLA